MEDKVDQQANVRLKVFLARQFDRRPGKRVSWKPTGQQVAVLASLTLMKEFAGRPMNETEIGSLFVPPLSASQLHAIMGKLESGLLVAVERHTAAGKFYCATPVGRDRLSEFIDTMLGTPASVEAELRANEKYHDLIEMISELIDRDLASRFAAATKEKSRASRSAREHIL